MTDRDRELHTLIPDELADALIAEGVKLKPLKLKLNEFERAIIYGEQLEEILLPSREMTVEEQVAPTNGEREKPVGT